MGGGIVWCDELKRRSWVSKERAANGQGESGDIMILGTEGKVKGWGILLHINMEFVAL